MDDTDRRVKWRQRTWRVREQSYVHHTYLNHYGYWDSETVETYFVMMHRDIHYIEGSQSFLLSSATSGQEQHEARLWTKSRTLAISCPQMVSQIAFTRADRAHAVDSGSLEVDSFSSEAQTPSPDPVSIEVVLSKFA